MLNYLIFWRIHSQPSWLFFYNLLIFFSIIGAILAYEFNNHIIIISTSFVGSYLTVRSLSLIFGGFPNEFELNLNINTSTLTSFPWQFYVYFILIIILFILGVIFQFSKLDENLENIVQNEKLVSLIEKTNKNIEQNQIDKIYKKNN